MVEMREVDSLVALGVSTDMASLSWGIALIPADFRFMLPVPEPPSGDIGAAARVRPLAWGDRRELLGMLSDMIRAIDAGESLGCQQRYFSGGPTVILSCCKESCVCVFGSLDSEE